MKKWALRKDRKPTSDRFILGRFTGPATKPLGRTASTKIHPQSAQIFADFIEIPFALNIVDLWGASARGCLMSRSRKAR
jgi:hypothetical protein